MEIKAKYLLFVPFSIGSVLFACSWYLSYPFSLSNATESIFNHVSILYWISLPLLLASMFLIAATFNNRILKWLLAFGSVLLLYSLYYFFITIPGSDAPYFRSMTQYFLNTGSLDPSLNLHLYFQYPSFFIFSKIATDLSGLPLTSYEFVQFSVIGLLIVSSLFLYASRVFRKGGFLAPIAFFVALFYFIDYQNVPFALAFGLFFVLIMIDTTHKMNFGIFAATILIFSTITLGHAFVPLFFVIYLLIQSIIKRNKLYWGRFLATLAIYFIITLTFSGATFLATINGLIASRTPYSGLVEGTFSPTLLPADIAAQNLSRLVTVGIIALCLIGSVFLIAKRKLRDSDKSIFIVGLIWSGLGLLLGNLGERALPLIFMPLALGVAYLFESKYKKYVSAVFLTLLVLAVGIPIHNAYSNPPMLFQTRADQNTATFLINNYNWNLNRYILADGVMRWYIAPQVANSFDQTFTSVYNSSKINLYDCIIYTVVLAKGIPDTQNGNGSSDQVSQQIKEDFNIIYNSGSDYIATLPNNR
jgi:hypothetical protein